MNKITLIGSYNKEDKVMVCKRLSNNYDVIPVQFPDVVKAPDKSGEYKMEGSIINQKGNGYVDVVSIEDAEGIQNTTACELKGPIKKLYPVRVTKKGHKLQDMLVDADGQLVKVVAFEPCPDFVKVGVNVRIRGRLQSRAFTQLTTFGTLSKIVYEVALKNLEVLEQSEDIDDLFADLDDFDTLEPLNTPEFDDLGDNGDDGQN